MKIFRFSFLVAALFATASSAQVVRNEHAQLALAAKAALGRFEIRRRNLPGPGETTVVKADRLLELPFGPVLITKITIDKASHAEVGALGVYYLKRVGDRYVLRKAWPEVVEGRGFGFPPDWRLTTQFTKYPAIYATSGWTGQGYVCGWSTLTELTPSGPVASDTIFSSYSNAGVGSGKLDETNGRVVNIRKASSFNVLATGTRRLVEHYVFGHGRFARIEKESQLQC